MQQAYIVTGALTNERTVTLDEALPVSGGKVRVIVEVLGARDPADYDRFMAELRARQRQRGHVPRSRQEIDAYLKAERASWDD